MKKAVFLERDGVINRLCWTRPWKLFYHKKSLIFKGFGVNFKYYINKFII